MKTIRKSQTLKFTVKFIEYLALTISILSFTAVISGLYQRREAKSTVIDLKKIISDTAIVKREDLNELNSINPDSFGWLRIPALTIDTPVMYRKGDSEFYLTHDFYGNESVSGTPFIAGEGGSGMNHLIIYGHHMADGSVFSPLDKFLEKSFFESLPEIELVTDSPEAGNYIPVAVVQTNVSGESFDYYNYTDLRNPEVWTRYLNIMKSQALYSRNTYLYPQLLTLFACSMHTSDERLVIVCQKKNQEEI